MKTEQERIEQMDKMAQVMCGFCTEDKRCVLRYSAPCSEVKSQDCSYKGNAEMLICAGYGKVSEYKAEIERLRQEVRDTDKIARNSIEQYKNNYDNASEILKAQEREIEQLNADYAKLQEQFADYQMASDKEIAAQAKQAKIDVLNELKTHSYFDDYYIDSYVFVDDIDELIKEVQNGAK